nr:MAG TPA: hypothetical protein [Caudoviricetes sp.]
MKNFNFLESFYRYKNVKRCYKKRYKNVKSVTETLKDRFNGII